MTMHEPITERVPSLSALKEAVAVMQADAIRITEAADTLFAQVRMMHQKLQIVCEVMDQLLGDQPPCPFGKFSELNHKDSDAPSE